VQDEQVHRPQLQLYCLESLLVYAEHLLRLLGAEPLQLLGLQYCAVVS